MSMCSRYFSPGKSGCVKVALLAATALITVVGLLVFIQTARFTSWDFRNNLWAPAYLLIHGQSPYDVSVLFDNSRAIWLPMAPGLLFPLGFLNQYQATNVWLIVNVVLLFGMVWLIADRQAPPPWLIGLVLALVFLFPPTISHLLLGQFTLLAMFVLMLAALWLEFRSIWLIGFLIAVSLSKPQVALGGVLGVLVFTFQRNGWRGTLSLMVSVAVWSLILVTPLWLMRPDWLKEFAISLGQNPVWDQPALFSALPRLAGTSGLGIWLLSTGCAVVALVRIWMRSRPFVSMLWSLALTPLISPYIWSWDFVMMLPLWSYALFDLKTKLARFLLVVGYIMCWTLLIYSRLSTDNNDGQYWWFPVVFFASISGGIWLDRRLVPHLTSVISPNTAREGQRDVLHSDQ